MTALILGEACSVTVLWGKSSLSLGVDPSHLRPPFLCFFYPCCFNDFFFWTVATV
jgi:hypothetical protein